jgi:enterochelin esterase-like enzyme
VSPDQARELPAHVLRALHGAADALGSWWTVGALAAVVTALVVLTVHRRHRRRWWPRAIAAAGAAALTALAGVNAYAGYVPSIAALRVTLASQGNGSFGSTDLNDPGTARTGTVHAVSIPVPDALRMPRATTWVYTPPGYDPSTTRYPVVYLIHGEPGTSSDWLAGGDAAHTMDVLIDTGLIRPMILVMPDDNGVTEQDTECLDSTTGGPQVETYLLDVVVPWTDQHLATVADPEHRVIGGMSAGAYCAVDQGLRHQDVFSTILGIVPYVEPGAGGRRMLSTSAQYDAHDVAQYLPTIELPRPVAVFVDVPGRELASHEASQAATLVRLLRARGEQVEYRAEPHQYHTWTMARTALPYALVFASEHLPGTPPRG